MVESFTLLGKKGRKYSLGFVTLRANIQGNILGVYHGLSPKASGPLPGEILSPLQLALLGTANV
jgi:hypothetical protein